MWLIKPQAAGLNSNAKYCNKIQYNITILKIHGLLKRWLYVPIDLWFVQCIVDPGRQTLGCRPRLEVLNLGLGTLVG